jgi:hypothetical protein
LGGCWWECQRGLWVRTPAGTHKERQAAMAGGAGRKLPCAARQSRDCKLGLERRGTDSHLR